MTRPKYARKCSSSLMLAPTHYYFCCSNFITIDVWPSASHSRHRQINLVPSNLLRVSIKFSGTSVTAIGYHLTQAGSSNYFVSNTKSLIAYFGYQVERSADWSQDSTHNHLVRQGFFSVDKHVAVVYLDIKASGLEEHGGHLRRHNRT